MTQGREQISTVFKLQVGPDVAYLTTAHSVSAKSKDLTVTFRCGNKVSKQRVVSSESLPGIDAAVLGLAEPIAEMPAFNPSHATLGQIRIPYYPNLAVIDSMLLEVAVQIEGQIFNEQGGKLYYTATPIRQGASGAPLLNETGQVVGISVGRLMDGNVFSGIGYGETIERLLATLAIRNRGGGNGSAGGLLNKPKN